MRGRADAGRRAGGGERERGGGERVHRKRVTDRGRAADGRRDDGPRARRAATASAPAPPPNAAELVLAAAGSLELTRDAGDGVVSSDDAAPARLALTLSGCRFVEVEPTLEVGADADCLEVARRGVLGREAAVVRAPAGHVEFAVTNAGEREAGIWIRSSDRPGGAILSAGGVAAGSTGSWDVELAPGTYLYSCPLTPTAIYTLEVW